MEDSVDTFVRAADEVIAKLQVRHGDNKHASEMAPYLSGGSQELGTVQSKYMLSIREALDRSHR